MTYDTIEAIYNPVTRSIPITKKGKRGEINKPIHVMVTFITKPEKTLKKKTTKEENLDRTPAMQKRYESAKRDLDAGKNMITLEQLQAKYA